MAHPRKRLFVSGFCALVCLVTAAIPAALSLGGVGDCYYWDGYQWVFPKPREDPLQGSCENAPHACCPPQDCVYVSNIWCTLPEPVGAITLNWVDYELADIKEVATYKYEYVPGDTTRICAYTHRIACASGIGWSNKVNNVCTGLTCPIVRIATSGNCLTGN